MPYTKVNMYKDVLPFVKPQAQTPTPQTLEVDGWRAPNQPTKVSNTQPQVERQFDLENIHWGLQTVITPMIETIVSAVVGSQIQHKTTTVSIPNEASTVDAVLQGQFIAPPQSEGVAGLLNTIDEIKTEGAVFNAVVRVVNVLPHPFNRQYLAYAGLGTKIKLAFYETNLDVDYRYKVPSDGSGLIGINEAPLFTVDLEWISTGIDSAGNTNGYYKGQTANPISFTAVSRKIYVGLIAGTDCPSFAGTECLISFGVL